MQNRTTRMNMNARGFLAYSGEVRGSDFGLLSAFGARIPAVAAALFDFWQKGQRLTV
jgi:hypothetical protein